MRNRRLTLWLSCCLLATPSWSTAQTGFMMALTQHRQATDTPGEVAAIQNRAEPITIPTGTHLLLKLTSALHTTSGTPGAGVYLETSFPVIVDDRVAIPEHTSVLGIVERERRPGRVRGRAQMRMRFTEFILPDDRVLSVAASLQSHALPSRDPA